MDRKIVITLDSLLESRDGPTVLIDSDYRIVAANKAYCESYGVSMASVVGRTCHEISHHSDVPCHEHGEHCPHREVFEHGTACEVSHVHFDFNKHADCVRIRAYPLHDESGRRYLMESIQRLAPRTEMDVESYRLAGKSPSFLRFFSQLSSVARTGLTVWLRGEIGTGKGIAARFIHEHSTRKTGPFVRFNCAECPPAQCEAALFPTARDAMHAQPYLFDAARGGTLYLEDFDALPLAVQGKLLRILDSDSSPTPDSEPLRPIDVRLIVGSQGDLARLMEEGRFRQDLYYRIAEFPLNVPALRERSEDIPIIALSILREIARDTGLACELSQDAADALMLHPFPGNLRELRTLLLGAAARCRENCIEAGDLDFSLSPLRGPARAARPPGQKPSGHGESPLPDTEAPPDTADEAETIRTLLRRYGSRRAVAKKLGISVPTLYRKMKQLGIINL